jgi:quercetin dioxygenase-like cupin family protein
VLLSPSRPQCLLLLKTAAKRSRRTSSRRYPPGKSLVVQFVDYAPGGASPSHSHAKSAFVFAYVLSGEIESQVNEEPKRVYRAGESWYETPGSIHRVSRNASNTEPAKLLAVFVVDTEDKKLTTPLTE